MTNKFHFKTEEEVLNAAKFIMEEKVKTTAVFPSSTAVKEYAKLLLGGKDRECFCALFLDSQHRLIVCKELFKGTIDGAAVYPREVVRETLNYNAAAVIFAHNHPSGVCEPSASDIKITKRLIEALKLIDVRVLDHIVVGEQSYSFAENGTL